MKEVIEDLKTYLQLIKGFNLLIKLYYCIPWSEEKTQKIKIEKLKGQKTEEQCFYQNVQCMIIKN